MKNQVLQDGAIRSQNFYRSDMLLQHLVERYWNAARKAYFVPHYVDLGEKAATIMDALSLEADKNPPNLVKRNHYGETINDIKFHAAYNALLDIAAGAEMFYPKWNADLRASLGNGNHAACFVIGQLFCMSEMGQYCPLAMTDGVARLIERYGDTADQSYWLPKLSARSGKDLATGAMFLTEKSGGSDVGANLVSATPLGEGYYHLIGEKWFCSNVNADLIFVLARTDAAIAGTKGLSIFLVSRYLKDGSRNPMEVVRLKDKLGVRSMASAECLLQNTVGKLYGKEGEGMKIMLDMIALMRIYNAVTALAGERRALVEAYQHLSFRNTFGKNALEHPLIRTKLASLCSTYSSDFYLTWHCIFTMDSAETGDAAAIARLRLLTPMVKYWTGKNTVHVVRECMELVGGLGYIEDGILPKLFRDVLVLPIWEGAGNIMLLDMWRATQKSDSLQALLTEMELFYATTTTDYPTAITALEHWKAHYALIAGLTDRQQQEANLLNLFESLIGLYQDFLLRLYRDSESEVWINAALDWRTMATKAVQTAPSVDCIRAMMGWCW